MTSRLQRRSICVLLAGGLLMAACSSDDDASPDTTSSPETTPDTSEASETTDAPELDGDGLDLGILTPSPGLLSTLFQAQVRGVDFAADDIASGGGVLDGPLNITNTDTPLGAPPAEAVAPALAAGAQVLLGPADSTGAAEVRDEVDAAAASACSASASVPGLTYGQEQFGLFRTALPDDVTVSYLADTIVARRDEQAPGEPWNVAIVARSDDYGLTLGNSLAVALQSRGLVPNVIDYNPRRVLFVGTANEVSLGTPDQTVIVSYEEGTSIVTELIRAGISPSTMIGLDAFFQPRVATQAGPDGDAESVDGFTMVGTVGDQAFLTRLFDADPNGQVAGAAQAYDCAITFALATEAVEAGAADSLTDAVIQVTSTGNTCTTYGDCLTKLEAGDDIDYDGPSGNLAIDEAGDPTFGRFATAAIEAGEIGDLVTVDVDVAAIRRDEATVAAASFTTQVQQALTFLGFYTGPIDGIWTPEVSAALAAFQTSVGLPPSGVMDAATYDALTAALGENSLAFAASTLELQVMLTELGFYDGPIDGIWNEQLTEAIRAVQRELGVPETGILDAATLQAIYEQGVTSGSTPPPTTVAPETTVAPATTAPATTAPPTTAPPTTPPPDTTVPPTAPPTTDPPPDLTLPTLFETLSADPDFANFTQLAVNAGYGSETNPGPFTVFAPTNDALSEDRWAELAALPQNEIQDWLAIYLADGDFTTDTLPPLLENHHGWCLEITGQGTPDVAVDTAPVTRPNIVAFNGIIQGLGAEIVVPPEPPTDCVS